MLREFDSDGSHGLDFKEWEAACRRQPQVRCVSCCRTPPRRGGVGVNLAQLYWGGGGGCVCELYHPPWSPPTPTPALPTSCPLLLLQLLEAFAL
jgi:hypothetical protein